MMKRKYFKIFFHNGVKENHKVGFNFLQHLVYAYGKTHVKNGVHYYYLDPLNISHIQMDRLKKFYGGNNDKIASAIANITREDNRFIGTPKASEQE